MMTPRCKPDSCLGCPLHEAGTDFTQSEGTGRLGIAIIAEASGEMEARDSLPLRPYAPSGSVLERTIRRLGLAREDFIVSNVIRCRPWGNVLEGASYEYEAIRHCESNMLDLFRRSRPKVVVALGNVPI